MLNVLVNAYAVSPAWGSEPGMGWNWVVNLAQYCNVFVITEGEVAHRDRGDCGKVAATGQLAFLLQSRVGTCTPDVLESGRLAFLLALP